MNKNSTRLIAWPSAEGDLVLEDTITTIGSSLLFLFFYNYKMHFLQSA